MNLFRLDIEFSQVRLGKFKLGEVRIRVICDRLKIPGYYKFHTPVSTYKTIPRNPQDELYCSVDIAVEFEQVWFI